VVGAGSRDLTRREAGALRQRQSRRSPLKK
jgi:hypothetical protein